MAVEFVLTFAANETLKKVLSLAEKEFSLAWGFKAELRKLQESFTSIELLLNDVADKPQAPPIEEWVKKLKGVADDAEDVLDEFQYEVDRRKVEIQNHMKKKVLNFFSLSNPLAFRLKMAHKIQKINASLVDLERKAIPLGLVSKTKDATPQGIRWDRQTHSLIGKDEKTFGREDDVSNIVKTLIDSKTNNQEDLGVMAIVGMGGLGKTTLAKSVYNEDSIHKFFEKRIWVCVSNTFDVTLILRRMLESLTLTKAPSKDNQDAILKKLQEELKDKRYLLVLDDVWNEDAGKWEYLMECLSKLNSAGGSKIIVTTRSGKIALMSKKLLPQHDLEKLSEDQCWSIMKNKTFPNSSDSEFEAIGKEIAKNCGGVPLVAKVLGSILQTKKSIEEWSSFKNNGIWNNLSKREDRIMPVLTGDSCGIDNTLEIRHVAQVSTSTLEKIPKRSARKLRSLFFDGEVPTNILPRFKCLRVLNLSHPNIEEYPVSVERLKHLRYLDISCTRFKALPKSIGKLYNLQTLRAMNCDFKEFPKELKNLINLRHIYFDEHIKFPNGIGQLTSLRTLPYFSVGNEIGLRIEELAGLKQLKGELIVCNLEHVKNGEEAKKAKLEDKTKIRHLSFNWTEDRSTTDNNEEEDVLEGLRPHLELESLSIANFMGDKFPTWMMSGSLMPSKLKKIELLGCDKCEGVPPLGHLPSLRELNIRGMANLNCVGAEFYGYGLVHNVATTSKGTIALFPALKVLYIYDCGDLIEWMEAPLMSAVMVFPCLERLVIHDCVKLRHLPDWLDTLPLLKELTIEKCPSLELIPITQGMTSLCELVINDCGQLSRPPSGLEYCTSLQKLSIKKCDGLSGPLSLWVSPVELRIKNCKNLASIEIKGSGSLTASLQKLTISFCDELTRLPALPQQCPSLQELGISGCPKLSSFGVKSSRVEKEDKCISLQSTSDLRTMTSLRQLYIRDCESLESWVSSLQFPLSLEELLIQDIPNLEILPSLDHLSSLRDLSIVKWRNLKYLPTGLPRLKELSIGGFWEELDSFPDFQVGSFMHLTSLKLYGWPKLKSLPQQIQHLTSLTDLTLYQIDGVETLPEWLGSLTSLGSLCIYHCKNLMNLPSVQAVQRLTKLCILYIYGCHPLLEERCRRDSGTDWPKISHIPRIIIR